MKNSPKNISKNGKLPSLHGNKQIKKLQLDDQSLKSPKSMKVMHNIETAAQKR
jgi:hypothetical protein